MFGSDEDNSFNNSRIFSMDVYKNFFDNISEGVMIFQDSLLKFSNPATEKILGYNFDEISEFSLVHFAEMVHKDDRDEFLKWIDNCSGDKAVESNMQFRIMDNNGDIKWIKVNSSYPVFNEKPAIQIVLSDVTELNVDITERKKMEEEVRNTRDQLELRVRERTEELFDAVAGLKDEITERKNIENALRRSREQLEVTLRSIVDGVITTDIAGKITMMNKVAENLTGWSLEDALSQPIKDVFNIMDEKSAQRMQVLCDKFFLQEKKAVKMEGVILTSKDGGRKNIEYVCAPMLVDNKRTIGSVLTFRDVTEKLRMEEEILQAQKLESVGILAGGIAHDFNNILTGILGYISMAIETTREDGNEYLIEILKKAENATLRAKTLTKQLLTFSRGGVPIRKECNISGLIHDSADFALSGSKVGANIVIPKNLWFTEIDADQITLTLSNIIINAKQFMPSGGEIEIVARNVFAEDVEILQDRSGKFVEIKIIDHGPGIKKEIIEKIFFPYFTTKENGDGLGLAIAYSIIDKHDGIISVDSEYGHGATFKIYLPALDRKKTEQFKVKPKSLIKNRKLLIMDDEDIIRQLCKSILEHNGYKVDVAKNGNVALDLYKKSVEDKAPYDLVILDITVPGGMGGEETISKLRTINPAVKALVSSGYSNDPIMAKPEKFGFMGVLPKPYSVEDLINIVQRTVSLH